MTQRDFLTIIKSGTITDEIIKYATTELDRLDERDEKRENYRASSQKKNDEIKKAILDYFVRDTPMTGREVAEKVGISSQKANALLRQLVDDNRLAVALVVTGKRFINSYSLV